jgi:uncharacterized coiled-coil protein SlyX
MEMEALINALKGIVGVLTALNIFVAGLVGFLLRPIRRRLSEVEKTVTKHSECLVVLQEQTEDQERDLEHIRTQVDLLVSKLIPDTPSRKRQ